MPSNPETNKQAAIEFYRLAYLGNPTQAVEMYVGANYIQHNPAVANGKQGNDYRRHINNESGFLHGRRAGHNPGCGSARC